MSQTTIAAVATPPGAGARGVIRISGPAAAELVRATWAGAEPPALTQRAVLHGRFRDGRGEQPLMLLWMPGPRSYTREDVAELHLPGSPPLLARALERLLELGAVSARPGEFTRRAFEHGRIDLSRAEGVLELVAAGSAEERRAALALLGGGLERRVEGLRDALGALRALCEASLDFDESDTGHVPRAELEGHAHEVRAGLTEALGWEERRGAQAGTPTVVVCGAPNAGKSSLFNLLVAEEGALVSGLAGTTRDGVAADWSLAGGVVRLFDSAGLDPRAVGVEARVQELARGLRAGADLALWVVDATRSDPEALAAEGRELGAEGPLLLVWNKLDLVARPPALPGLAHPWVAVSARTGAGLDGLCAAVARALGLGLEPTAEVPAGAPAEAGGALRRELTARHRAALAAAVQELDAGLAAWRAGAPLDLFAEHLRGATGRLDEISGRTTPEDLLDRIFARFCLGK